MIFNIVSVCLDRFGEMEETTGWEDTKKKTQVFILGNFFFRILDFNYYSLGTLKANVLLTNYSSISPYYSPGEVTCSSSFIGVYLCSSIQNSFPTFSETLFAEYYFRTHMLTIHSHYFTYSQRKQQSLSIPIKTLKYLGEITLDLECGITEIAIGHGWEAVSQNIAIYRS